MKEADPAAGFSGASLFGRSFGTGPAPLWIACLLGWGLVALVSAAQGQIFALYQGRNQAWWPSLGYTAAVFSIWAILTPAALGIFRGIAASRLGSVAKAALIAASLPALVALHVLLFVGIFWAVYGPAGSTPWTMAQPVLAANLDKAAFAFAALVTVALSRRHNSARAWDEGHRPVALGLWIKGGGAIRLISFEDIDCIVAAGDYAEINAGQRAHLTDRPLAALSDELPRDEFARIHRSTIVRLDRIREVRPMGRGDAVVLLRDGRELRLSRRFRGDFQARLLRSGPDP